jgi:hypothetical protein
VIFVKREGAGAADVQRQLMQPALDADIRRQPPWRKADAKAEHRLAAQAFDMFDAAHQLDEHDHGQPNPMPPGIEKMPMIRIVKGIQNRTVAIAAPVSNEAVGATPMSRAGAADAPPTSAGAGVASGLVSVTATMPSTFGSQAARDMASSREPDGGNPP